LVKIILFLLLNLCLYAKTFNISTYNVENLFDLKNNRSDYKEYIPNNYSKWDKKKFTLKLTNLIKVLKDLDSDIIALQEVENRELMQLLLKKLPKYKYYSFSKYENASVGIGFLSKIKIIKNQDLNIKFPNKIYRPILETTFKIDNYEFKIFNNHWPSKRVAESYRIKYAKKLFDRVNELPKDYDYILLGDFNSNYNEFETIYYEKRLNNTQGVTGINQVLNTTVDKKYITVDDILRRDKRVHYNLWLQVDYPKRFSTIFRGNKYTPDNIILSPALFDNKKLSYKLNSFKVFAPQYLYKNEKINRWQIKDGIHTGKGFSDHLPLTATFSSKKEDKNPLKKIPEKTFNKISDFYNTNKLLKDADLKNVVVIYKDSKSAVIKQKNDRAIYLYNNVAKLKEGYSYDLRVSQIKEFFGLKEIKKFKILEKNKKIPDYKKLYLEGKDIDILDLKYQNEIVTNIQGVYKNKKLLFNNKEIKLYFRKKSINPKEGSFIKIKRAQIGFFKNSAQLVIHKKSDIDVN
jgi:endonuclease/exonuclease/phosphatase family metal-dependent hydrolase